MIGIRLKIWVQLAESSWWSFWSLQVRAGRLQDWHLQNFEGLNKTRTRYCPFCFDQIKLRKSLRDVPQQIGDEGMEILLWVLIVAWDYCCRRDLLVRYFRVKESAIAFPILVEVLQLILRDMLPKVHKGFFHCWQPCIKMSLDILWPIDRIRV